MRKLFLFIVCFILFGVGIKAQRFPQAVLPGDYLDPSILRDGKNYYMTHSPFYYAPGFLIWHSTDLMFACLFLIGLFYLKLLSKEEEEG